MKALIVWLRQPFNLLDSVGSRWKLIIFCGVFGCLFLNVFKPFNLTQWFDGATPLFIILTFFSIAGMAALGLTQFVIRGLFHLKLATRIGFLAWLLLDFFFISVAVFTVDILLLDLSFFNLAEYLSTLKFTLLVVVLPYFIGILLLYLQQQLQVVEELTLKANKAPSTMENVTVTDENGRVAVSMPMRSIIYFKSEDNYILLFYRHDNELRRELIRTSLKKLEQDLTQPNFVRIHRSYMINSLNLLSAVKTPRGYQVRMEVDSQHHLPVSATYHRSFEEKVVQV